MATTVIVYFGGLQVCDIAIRGFLYHYGILEHHRQVGYRAPLWWPWPCLRAQQRDAHDSPFRAPIKLLVAQQWEPLREQEQEPSWDFK